jgi:hypothetical protein
VELRKQMVERYQYAKTVPGTRSYHQFIPLSNTKLAAKRYPKKMIIRLHSTLNATQRLYKLKLLGLFHAYTMVSLRLV